MTNGSGISVAMCTYNGAAYLARQLDSIACQTLLPDELVICDDRSGDATLELIDRFSRSAPFPITCHQNHVTLRSTKNFDQAISLCAGDLIALSDQDDIWHPDKLKRLAEVLSLKPEAGGVFSDGDLIDDQSRPRGASLWESFGFTRELRRAWRQQGAAGVLLRQEVVTGATLMFRASLRPLILPIPAIWVHDAWIAWILALASVCEYCDMPLISYRVHPAQQEGIPARRLLARAKLALRDNSAEYSRAVRRFEELERRMEQWRAAPAGRHAPRIRRKIEHLGFRANLPAGRIRRIEEVLKRFRDYQQYSRGAKEMVKDLLCA